MQRTRCQECGSEHPRAQIVRLNEKLLCQPCASKGVDRLRAASQAAKVSREVDPTICTQCQADHGSNPLPLIGGLPFCAMCAPSLYNRPFPGWLKGSLAAMLVLLAFALWHGSPYFHAGKALARGERAMDRQEYRAAAANFEEVLKVAPSGQKVVLLTAKAYILSGDVSSAQKALDRRSRYETDSLFQEVQTLWTRATGAWEKAVQASKLADAGNYEEAAKLMDEASRQYPESSDLAIAAITYAGSSAFEQKDYQAFLDLSSKALQTNPQDPELIAMAASAMACKYAVTGDRQARRQTEELLARAQSLSNTPELKASYQEYSERIRYRLESREIISRKEYDRRFRQAAQDARKGNS